MESPFGKRTRCARGVVLVGLALMACGCGDDKKTGPGAGGILTGTGGAGGGAGQTGAGSAGNPFAGGASGSLGGASGGGGMGGAGNPDGGAVPMGPAGIKFCNTLVMGTEAMPMPTTLDLVVGSTKLTATTGTCSPMMGMACPTFMAGNVAMTLQSMGMPVAAEVETLAPGREYRILTDIDPMTGRPILRAFALAATPGRCANYAPSRMARVKFCNLLFMNNMPSNIELSIGATKLTAMGGTCSSAINQSCGTVPADVHMVSMTSGGVAVGQAAELEFETDNDYIMYAMLENGQPGIGGIVVPEENACTKVDYKQVEAFLTGGGSGAGGMGMMGMGGATGMGGSRL